MTNRGRIAYIPPAVLQELNVIKNRKNLEKERWQSDAFKEMVDYSKLGRKVEEMRDRFVFADMFNKKKRKNRGIF